jgi:hypothetical protein
MPGQFIVRVVGAIGLAVFANTPACASDVSAMSCSQIGGFARQVAEQKLKGVTLKDAVRRLRKSSGSQYADTDHELENIVRGIYRIPIFSTVSPEEVGSAYQIACEKGKSRAQITAIIYKERSPDCGVSNRPRCPDPPLGARRRAGGRSTPKASFARSFRSIGHGSSLQLARQPFVLLRHIEQTCAGFWNHFFVGPLADLIRLLTVMRHALQVGVPRPDGPVSFTIASVMN